MSKHSDDKKERSRCSECNAFSNYLICRKCKESWRKKVIKLHGEGVSPLSIAVRINKPWILVVKFLIDKGLVDHSEWNMMTKKRDN